MQNASNFEAPRNLNFAPILADRDEVSENSSEQEHFFVFSFNYTTVDDADIDDNDDV